MLGQGCELPEYNPPSEQVKAILAETKTVAVVGLSPKPERDSHKVAKYLKENGFVIIPVNPGQKKILGETCYRDLRAIPHPVDMVNIFRRPDAVPPIVNDAIAIKAKYVWMQLGIVHNEASKTARQEGLEVVMNKCIKIEHMGVEKELHPSQE